MSYRPNDILGSLVDHRVKFVLIGGLSAVLRGAPVITDDVDVCYERSDENLDRLADALQELGAKLRGEPDDVPFILDAKTLKAGDHFTFLTSAGALDLLGSPAGVRSGYEELVKDADVMHIRGIAITVASLDSLIRMKLAAGRPKDLEAVETIGALREELEKKGKS
jgi:hypothetical protein